MQNFFLKHLLSISKRVNFQTIRKERQNEELSSSSSGEEQSEHVGAVLDEFSYKATGDSTPAGPRDMGKQIYSCIFFFLEFH